MRTRLFKSVAGFAGVSLLAGAMGVIGAMGLAPGLAGASTTTTLYVSRSATTGGVDTSCSTAAYTSIQEAVDAAASGDTVVVCTGIYNIDIPGEGTATNPVAGENPYGGIDLYQPITVQSSGPVTLTGTGPIFVIYNLKQTPAPTTGCTTCGVNGPITIKGFSFSDVTGSDYNGVITVPGYGAGDVTIENNTFSTITTGAIGYHGSPGLTSPLGTNWTISGNTVTNAATGTNAVDGMFLGDLSDSTIADNSVSHTSYAGIILTGLTAPVSEHTNFIENNTVSDVPEEGIQIAFGSNDTVSDNTVTNAGNGATSGPGSKVGYVSGRNCAICLFQTSQTDISVTGNSLTDSYQGVGIGQANASPGSLGSGITVTDNAIVGDTNAGVANNATTGTLQATDNWWGSASGPGPVGPGSGSGVSSGVDFSNWCVTSTCPSVPGAPTGATATVPSSGVHEAQVSWTAPVTDGGSAFTGYSVTPFDQTTGVSMSPQSFAATTTLPVTVTGLTAGDSYTFSVTATNAVGTGSASAASNSIEPVGIAPSQTKSATTTTSASSATASVGTDGMANYVSATASGGTGTVTVSSYPSDPLVGFHAGTAYFDVSLSAGNTFTQVGFEVCGLSSNEAVQWFDPITQQVVRASDQTAPSGTGGCVTVMVTPTTTPDLAQLYGTVFAVAPTAGYWEVASDGGIFTFGGAKFYGSMGGTVLNKPVVGMAAMPTGNGYYEVASDGGIFSFGSAKFHGSMGGIPLNKPVVGMAVTPTGNGYWEVASDGGIFSFGSAKFYGSMGGTVLNKPVVGMAAMPTGNGYYEVASDGGIFSFGSAKFHGSMGGIPLNKPVVGMAATSTGGGYWEVASDGGLFSFGNAEFHGSMGGIPLNKPVVGMAATSTGGGYWEVASDGGIFSFGSAKFEGSMGGTVLNKPMVGMAES